MGKVQAGALAVVTLVAIGGLGALFLADDGQTSDATPTGLGAGDSSTAPETPDAGQATDSDISSDGVATDGETEPGAVPTPTPTRAASDAVEVPEVGAIEDAPPKPTVARSREWLDAEALGKAYPNSAARAALVDYLTHEEQLVRVRAAISLANWEDSGPELLAKAKVEARPEVGAAFIEALGHGAAGTKDMIPKLQQLSMDRGTHGDVRRASDAAIAACSKRAGIMVPSTHLRNRRKRRPTGR